MESRATPVESRSSKRRWIRIMLIGLATLITGVVLTIECGVVIVVNSMGVPSPGMPSPPPLPPAGKLLSLSLPLADWLVPVLVLLALTSVVMLLVVFALDASAKTRVLGRSRIAKGAKVAIAALTVIASLGVVVVTPAVDPTGMSSLSGAAMISAEEGWAVGGFLRYEGGGYGIIWHYSQGHWQQVPQVLTGHDLSGVAALPDGEAWAVGTGETILHERAGYWSVAYQGGDQDPEDLAAVAMVSPEEGWAVGGYELVASRPAPALSANLLSSLFALPARSSAGSFCFLLHYLHGSWRPVSCPAPVKGRWGNPGYLTGLSVLASGEAWAVGSSGIILHEQGGVWRQEQSFLNENLTGISMVSPEEGWAVSEQGTVFHYYNHRWTALSTPYQGLYHISMVSANEGWITGGNGLILHLTQGTWLKVKSPSNEALNNLVIQPGDPKAGWIVGSGPETSPVDTGNKVSLPTILYLSNGVWRSYQS